MPKRIAAAVLAILLLLLIPLSVGAAPIMNVPYTTYDYNFFKESIAAPAGYVPSVRIDAESLGLETALSAPSDIFYDGEDRIYLLDTKNARVVVMTTDFKLVETVDIIAPPAPPTQAQLDEFACESVEEYLDLCPPTPAPVTTATGVTVGKDGKLYIADPESERVIIFNADRTYLRSVTRPQTARLDQETPFNATKVMVDDRHNLYVLTKSGNMGAFVFDKDGKYQRLFGGNSVVQTAEVIMKYMLRPFLTQAQLEGMTSSVPTTIVNFDVDAEGFVYTATPTDESANTVEAGVIRKLNYLGQNILDKEDIFGDQEWDRQSKQYSVTTTFTDVDVDEQGFINMLDGARGKIFQYADTGELIAVFGSYGNQVGEFGLANPPQALESIGDNVVVVDTTKNQLVVFEPTDYAKTYREALFALREDDFNTELWTNLLEENSNNANAYYGLGRIAELNLDYKQAMEYYKLAGDREAYSDAFQENRNLTIKALFIPIVCVVAALLVAYFAYKLWRKKHPKATGTVVGGSAYSKLESKYRFPFYTLFHPMDGFSQLKPRKIGSLRVAWIILIALFVVFTMQFFLTGYIFNNNRIDEYSLIIMVLKTIGIALLFVVSNWAVCTLLNGNGNLREITCVTTYSLLPLIFAMFANVLLSNFLAGSEGAIMNIILVVCIMWSFLLLLCGLYCIHEYNMTQTFFSVIATVLGMAIIVFLLLMFASLLQQAGSFFYSIILEIIQRA